MIKISFFIRQSIEVLVTMRSLNAKVYVKGYNWHDLDSFKIKFKIFDKYPVLKR